MQYCLSDLVPESPRLPKLAIRPGPKKDGLPMKRKGIHIDENIRTNKKWTRNKACDGDQSAINCCKSTK